jgi:hypothetical protein
LGEAETMNPIQHPQRCETCDYFPAGSIFDERCPYSEFTWRHAGNHPQCIKDPFLASEIWQVPIDVMSELTSFIGCASHSSHSTVSGQPPVPGFFTPHYTHDEKMAIRRSIHRGGEQFYKSFSDIDDLQNIAGEFMSLNEDWCVLYPGTYGYEDRINTGFSQNQKHFLERIADKIRSRPVHQQETNHLEIPDSCNQDKLFGITEEELERLMTIQISANEFIEISKAVHSRQLHQPDYELIITAIGETMDNLVMEFTTGYETDKYDIPIIQREMDNLIEIIRKQQSGSRPVHQQQVSGQPVSGYVITEKELKEAEYYGCIVTSNLQKIRSRPVHQQEQAVRDQVLDRWKRWLKENASDISEEGYADGMRTIVELRQSAKESGP